MGFISSLKDKFSKKKDTNATRYLDGYKKTRKSFGERLGSVFQIFDGLSDDFLEELMIVLLESDCGVQTAEKIVDMVQEEGKDRYIVSYDDVVETVIEQMNKVYDKDSIEPIHYNPDGPTIILVVGINGSGKTTSIAKLAYQYKQQGKKVAVAAGDTFRAGAVAQLEEWARRLDIPCVKGKENADPSSVMVDACRFAKENDIDILLADTSGRLQNKANLMRELEKMHRVIGKEIENAPQETWLVLDATTGQNGMNQAEEFFKTSKVTGIILTKLDGTAKGGIILAIRDRLRLPVRYVGLGETMEDLREFDIDDFLYSIAEGIEDVR
ncbi:MAG: signal recognition particle-docking protein FtsY [Erysipelotrichaceae bacterium]|nr:signal recognition particle-docking protein FtsY [Erysipelotrichaceae bacterium]